MRIGIDARLINETGVGRYIRNLIDELSQRDSPYTFVVFLPKESYGAFRLPNAQWEKQCADVHWHTLKEQFVMPILWKKARLDLIHIPYFNVPIFSPVPTVVTIHDLTVLHFPTGKATTLPYLLYSLKRIGYQLVLRTGLWKAKQIIAVSKTVKEDIVKSCGIAREKITVTYEGVDNNIQCKMLNDKCQIKNKLKITQPYFLYVGNAYPHKNLDLLVYAFDKFKKSSKGKDFNLVFVGSDTLFYKRLHKLVGTLPCKDAIQFAGAITDENLVHAYTYAHALAFPSLSEGFGLPALEAIRFGCPVVCSDIPVFHEILQDYVCYFDPKSVDSLVSALKKVSGNKQVPDLKILERYSWKAMAEQTLALYERSACL